MAFLPDNYEPPAPTGGNYFKPIDGESRVRVAGSAITGYVGWEKTPEKSTPHRSKNQDDVMKWHDPPNNKVRHFWAFAVIDYADGRVKVWEVTQASVRDSISALIASPDWGDPKGYNLTVTKAGQKLDTTYSVIPSPLRAGEEMDERQSAAVAAIRLEELYSGGDPFENVEQDTASVSMRDAGEPHPAETADDSQEIPF